MKFRTLTAQTDFQAVYEQGLKQVSKSFVLFWLPAEREFRYAVVASRKTIGIAVKRNRAKRLLRELLTLVLTGKLKGNLVLVARAKLLNGSFADLKAELEKCLKNWQLV